MDWLDIALIVLAAALLGSGLVRPLRIYRPLLWGGAALACITGLYPRPGNDLAELLYGGRSSLTGVPSEFFAVIWWLLGAWLTKGVLDLVLRRTFFPNDNLPHARRLFADLTFAIVYLVAFFGIVDTVFKQPVSTLLATSGVLAIVLGMALQSTLGDAFSAIAINIDGPFRAGDWISLQSGVEGQVMVVTWRATRIRTSSNTTIAVPNSVIAKEVVTNYRQLARPCLGTIELQVDQNVPPQQVIAALHHALSPATGTPLVGVPAACATGIMDTLVIYRLFFPIDEIARQLIIRSEVITRIMAAFVGAGIRIGALTTDPPIVNRAQELLKQARLPRVAPNL